MMYRQEKQNVSSQLERSSIKMSKNAKFLVACEML